MRLGSRGRWLLGGPRIELEMAILASASKVQTIRVWSSPKAFCIAARRRPAHGCFLAERYRPITDGTTLADR